VTNAQYVEHPLGDASRRAVVEREAHDRLHRVQGRSVPDAEGTGCAIDRCRRQTWPS
jgi:hypothetical protein